MSNPGHTPGGKAISYHLRQRLNRRRRDGPRCTKCGSLLPDYRIEANIRICIDCERKQGREA